MGSQELFAGTISTLENALNLRSMRHSLIVTNIANKDTPNYKAFDLAVEEELKKMEGSNDGISLMRTNEGHISAYSSNEFHPEIENDSFSNALTEGVDGNTVNIDTEMTHLAENSIMYDAMAQIIHKKFQGLQNVIQGGGK